MANPDIKLHTNIEPRHNFGTVFRKVPKMLLSGHSNFDIVLQIPIPGLPPITKISAMCSPTTPDNNWCRTFTSHETIYIQTLIADIEEQNSIDSLLHSPLPLEQPDRPARALFGFIGKLQEPPWHSFPLGRTELTSYVYQLKDSTSATTSASLDALHTTINLTSFIKQI